MGNQLVGAAPSQIFPVEHYLIDNSHLRFDTSLGSTRFFKVGRAKCQEGLVVIKVFAIHDPSLPLATYRKQIDDIRKRLSSAVNCLPFQKTILQDKAGFLIREYVKSSLYDRISTRPFLTPIQKKLMAFQLLYALNQCHKVGVCHGDIKLENILVTSWNWLLLTDFASFKPSFIPEDNPADFTYFFDTSRRRNCYIAPERFHPSEKLNGEGVLFEEGKTQGELTPAMDIFSAGCALIELYNEGQPPFHLTELLSYRIDHYSPQKYLDNIEDEGIRNLLAHMIQKDPSARYSAEVYLDEAKAKVFPEYFYSFLQSYMLMFSVTQPILTADQKMARLESDIDSVIDIICKENGDGEGLVIITTLVTSCIRALKQSSSKIQALGVLHKLAQHSSSENILDRIIPYAFHLIHDPAPRVRIRAIDILTKVLGLVQAVPASDGNIFPEYILPGLAHLTHDPVVLVRCAYAANLADLAKTALRFIEESQNGVKVVDTGQQMHNKLSHEAELHILQDMIQHSATSLLTESENIVKITLMKHGINELCHLFGRQKANDVLLSHLITFLNDKSDKHLRGAFFDCIVDVVSYVGIHSCAIVTPLLQQGLTDPEEFIIVKAITAMRKLTLLQLLNKPSMYLLISESVCYLAHPNLWIRHAVTGFLAAVANAVDPVDVQCRVSTFVKPTLTNTLRNIDKEYLVLNALLPPIPRAVFDIVLKCPDIDLLLSYLSEQKKVRELKPGNYDPKNFPHIVLEPPQLKSTFCCLKSEGLSQTVEDQLVLMAKHLLKIHQHRNAYLHSNDKFDLKETNGRIELTQFKNVFPTHIAQLQINNNNDLSKRRSPDVSKLESGNVAMNSEWQHMFSSTDLMKNNITGSAGDNKMMNNNVMSDLIVTSDGDSTSSIHDKSYIQYHRSSCREKLHELIAHKQKVYTQMIRGREQIEEAQWRLPLPAPGWRCRRVLVAHLHEHRGSVNRVIPTTEKGKFASCSSDGTIRLWDCLKMEGRNIANRSRLLYCKQSGGALIGMTLCEGGNSLAVSTGSGSIFAIKIATVKNNAAFQSRQLNTHDDGCAVDINCFDSNVLVYATMYGSLVGWDLRSPPDTCAFRLDNNLKHGVITSFCLDTEQCWTCVATSSGYHTVWDLRFLLPIANCLHPNGYRIWKVIKHPTERSSVFSSVQNNNEVTIWNLGTQTRSAVLWGSTTPPLSNSQGNNNSICAMYGGRIDRNPFLFTGGTDMKIRYWDLVAPHQSHAIAPSALDSNTNSSSSTAYDSRMIDGMPVIHEIAVRSRSGTEDSARFDEMKKVPDEGKTRGIDVPSPGHNDCITDITLCQSNQCFLVTSARNGVIKVWR